MAATLAGEAAIRIVPSLRGFKPEADRQLKAYEFKPIEVRIDPGFKEADVKFAAWRQRQERNAINVPVRGDFENFRKEMQRTEVIFKRSAFRQAISLNVKVVGLDALPALANAAGSAASGVQALSQSLLLLPGLAGGALASVAALAIGLHGVSAAFKGYSTDTKNAAKDAKAQQDANRDLSRSYRDYQTAVKDTTREIQDLNAENRRSSLNVADAVLSVQEAADRLRDGGQRSILQLRRDQLTYLEAVDHLQDVNTKAQRTVADTSEANAKGIAGNDKVVNALDRIAKAQEAVNGSGISEAAKALAQMSPEARKTIEAIHAFDEQWKKLETTVQNNLFDGLSKSATDLGQRALPGLEIGLSRVASGLNTNFKSIAESLGDTKNGGLLQRVFGNTDDGLKKLSGAFDPLIHGILQVTKTSSDFLPRLGEAAEKVFKRFDDFATRISSDGTLARWIDTGLKAFTDLSSAVGNVFSLIGDVSAAFDTASGHTGGFTQTLKTGTQYLRDQVESVGGKAGLVRYFKQAKDFVGGIKDALNQMRPFFREIADSARQWSVGLFSVVGALAQTASFIDRNIFPLKYLLELYLTFKTVKPLLDGVTASWKNYNKAVIAANNLGVPGTQGAADALANLKGKPLTNQQIADAKTPLVAAAANPAAIPAAGLPVDKPVQGPPSRLNPLIVDASKTPILPAARETSTVSVPSVGPLAAAAQLQARADADAAASSQKTAGAQARQAALREAAESAARREANVAAIAKVPQGSSLLIDPKAKVGVDSYRQSVADMNAEVGKAFKPLLDQQAGVAAAGDASKVATPKVADLAAKSNDSAKASNDAAKATPPASKAVADLGGSANTAAPKVDQLARTTSAAGEPMTTLGNTAAGAAPKLKGLATEAGGAGSAIGSGGIGLVGKLGALAGALGPLAITTGVVFAVTALITKLGAANKEAAKQTQAHDDALKNLTTTLDGITGRATQQTLTQVGQDFQSVPGLAGQGPQNVNSIFPKVGINPQQAALAAADPAQTKLLADLTDPQDKAVQAQLENSDDYKRNKKYYDDAHIDSLTLAKAVNGDPDAKKKVQDLIDHPPTPTKSSRSRAGNAAPVALPSLDSLANALPNQDPFKAAASIRSAAEANRVKGTSIQQGTVASRGSHNLSAGGSGFFGAYGPENTAVVNGDGRAVLKLLQPPDQATLDYWRDTLHFDVGEVQPDGHSRDITIDRDLQGQMFDGFADGGLVKGVGGPRDDMNLVKVSPGEHITNAAATAFYGTKFFSDLNEMKIPKRALGGGFGAPFKLAPPTTPLPPLPPLPPTDPAVAASTARVLAGAGLPAPTPPPVLQGPLANVLPTDAGPRPLPSPTPPAAGAAKTATPTPAPAPTTATGGAAGTPFGTTAPDATPTPVTPAAPTFPTAAPTFDPTTQNPYVPNLSGTGALPDSKSTAASTAPNAPIIPNANILDYEAYVGRQYGLTVGSGADVNHGGTHSADGALHSFNRATDLGDSTQAQDGSIARFVQAWESDPTKVASTRQLIYQDPKTGQRFGIINGRVLGGAELNQVYGKDFPDHTDHVHLGLEGVPSDAVATTTGGGSGITVPTAGSTGIVGAFKKLLGIKDDGTGGGSFDNLFKAPSDKDGADFLKKDIFSVAGQAGTIGLEALGSFFGLDLSYLEDAKSAANFYLGKAGKNKDSGDNSGTDLSLAEMQQYVANNGPLDLSDPKVAKELADGGYDVSLLQASGLTTGGGDAAASNGPLGTPGAKGAEAYRGMVRAIVQAQGPGLGIPKAAYGEWEDALVKQIGTESGGNPTSVNTHDSDGKGGTQTVAGLLNFKAETFTGLGYPASQINNPQVQIAAAMRLVAKKGLSATGGPGTYPGTIGQGHGFYADGGMPGGGKAWVSPGEFHTNAKAVAHYGPALYNALNAKALPKLKNGGWWGGEKAHGGNINPAYKIDTSTTDSGPDGAMDVINEAMQGRRTTADMNNDHLIGGVFGKAVASRPQSRAYPMPRLAVGGFPFPPEGNVNPNGPLPLPPKPAPSKSTPQDILPMTGPPPVSSVGDPAARFKIPQAGSAPGPGATAPAPDPGALPKVQDALTTIGGAGGATQGQPGNPQPGATDNQGVNARSALGAAPSSTDHENPALKAGITGAASQVGSLVAQAASAAAGAASFGAAGGAGGSAIQGAFDIGGQVANNVANVFSSLLVGTATGGSTSNPSGVPLLPSREPQQSGVAANAPSVQHVGDNHYHVTDLDALKRQQETTAAQDAMPWIGKF